MNRFILLLGGVLAAAQSEAGDGVLLYESGSGQKHPASRHAALTAVSSIGRVRERLVSQLPAQKRDSFRKIPYTWSNYGSDLFLKEGIASGSVLALMGGTALYESIIKAHLGTFFGGFGSLLADTGLDYGLSSTWTDFGYRALVSSVSWSLGKHFGPVPPTVLRYALTYGALLHETVPEIWQGYFLPRFEGSREIELLNTELSRLFKIYYHTPSIIFTPDTGSPWLELSFASDDTDVEPLNRLETQLIHLRKWAQTQGIEGIHLYPGRGESKLKLWVAPVKRGVPGKAVMVPGRFGSGGASVWWTQFIKKSYPEKLQAYLLSPLHEDILASLPAVLSGEQIRPVAIANRGGKFGFDSRSSQGLSAVSVGQGGFLLFDSHNTQGYDIPEMFLNTGSSLDKLTLEALRTMTQYRNPAPSRGAHKLMAGIIRAVAYRAAFDWILSRIKIEPEERRPEARKKPAENDGFMAAHFPRVRPVDGESQSDEIFSKVQPTIPRGEPHLAVGLKKDHVDKFLAMPRAYEFSTVSLPQSGIELWEKKDAYLLYAEYMDKIEAKKEEKIELTRQWDKVKEAETQKKKRDKRNEKLSQYYARKQQFVTSRIDKVKSALQGVRQNIETMRKRLGKSGSGDGVQLGKLVDMLSDVRELVLEAGRKTPKDIDESGIYVAERNWDNVSGMAESMLEYSKEIEHTYQATTVSKKVAASLYPQEHIPVETLGARLENLKVWVLRFISGLPSKESTQGNSEVSKTTLSQNLQQVVIETHESTPKNPTISTPEADEPAPTPKKVPVDLIVQTDKPIQVLVMGRSGEDIDSVLADLHKADDAKLVKTALGEEQYVAHSYQPVPLGTMGAQVAYTTVTLVTGEGDGNTLPGESELLKKLVNSSHKLLWVGNLEEHEQCHFGGKGQQHIDDEALLFKKVVDLNNNRHDLAVVVTKTDSVMDKFINRQAGSDNIEVLPYLMNPMARKHQNDPKVLMKTEDLVGKGRQSVYGRVQGAFQYAIRFYLKHANGTRNKSYGYKAFLPVNHISLLGKAHYLDRTLYYKDLNSIWVEHPISWTDLRKTFLVRDSSPAKRVADPRFK